MAVFTCLKILFKKLSTTGAMSPKKIFQEALYTHLAIFIVFADRARQVEHVCCRLKDVRRHAMTLVPDKSFVPDALSDEICYLFFKLPKKIREKLAIAAVSHASCIVCKTKILSNGFNSDGDKDNIIEVSIPEQFSYKEYNLHERVYPTALMLKHLHLWLPNNSMRHRLDDLPPPDFDSTIVDAPNRIKLLSLSATGISTRIDNVDKEFVNHLENKNILFKLTLYCPMRKELPILAVGKCIDIFYGANLRRLSLWIQFHAIFDVKSPGQRWVKINKSGVHALGEWIRDDYTLLLEKRPHLFAYRMPNWPQT